MDPDTELVFQYPPFIRVYKSGRFERMLSVTAGAVPASFDPNTGITSRDVVIEPETGVKARLFLPNLTGRSPSAKIPVLVYYHGGGFLFGSTFSQFCHAYISSIVAQAHVLAVSVEYRLAPEHPLPTGHDDSWAALKWVASHAAGDGADEWLTNHADFERVFVAGDSAGGNIAHHMAMRAGEAGPANGVRIKGMVLLFPYFWGSERLPSEMGGRGFLDPAMVTIQWPYLCPGTSGQDDPLINPLAADAPSLAKLGCRRVLLCIGERDTLSDRARAYYKGLKSSAWEGTAVFAETEGEDHCFHLAKPESEKALALMQQLAAFLNEG